VITIPIDVLKRQLYIKFQTEQKVADIISRTNGLATYVFVNGETSQVSISPAGLRSRTVRVANLPPELANDTMRKAASKYVVVQNTWNKMWSNEQWGQGREDATNQAHAASQLGYIAGHRALISYTSQTSTRYTCNATDHLSQHCSRQFPKPITHTHANHSNSTRGRHYI
jgi:hypothetical protein